MAKTAATTTAKKYVSTVKTIKTAKFNGTGEERMVIAVTEGKTGIFVKATLRATKDADAVTGAREQFSDMKEAEKAFEKLCKTAETKGWKRGAGGSKNSFTELPAPTAAKAKK